MAKILVVEDETLIRFALVDELVDAGHTVVECANVLEAVAALSKHDDIDTMVTDVDMPGGLTGLDLARLIRQTRRLMPIWIVSGRRIDTSALDTSTRFLAKPYDMSVLVGEINRRITSLARSSDRQTISKPSARVVGRKR